MIRSHMVYASFHAHAFASRRKNNSRVDQQKHSSGHSTSMPTPFRKTPFMIVTKYRAGMT